jgi:hypothetical protein
MSVSCRRELMEIEHEAKEQLRDCSGISEIFDRWSNFTAAMAATLACRAGMPKGECLMLQCQ